MTYIKKTKISLLLPYENLDKLFTIIIGFILFYGSNNGSSWITFGISIITLLIVLIFSIDIKNIRIPKIIGYYTIHKFINAILVIATGYLLIKYSSITIATITWGFEFIIFILLGIIIKDNFSDIIKQTKSFYINRFFGSLFGWSGWIISMVVLKEAGIVLATLLGFLGIVFTTFTMKFILNDKPNKKQITMSIIVLILIGIGYYFK